MAHVPLLQPNRLSVAGEKWANRLVQACVAIVLWVSATFAFAHASLLDTQPSDDALLVAAPTEVRLRFNEPVAPLVFKLLLPNGSVVPLDQISTERDGLRVTLPARDAAGTYLLSWRVVSADGHPVGGALTYSVRSRSGVSRIAAASTPPALRAGIWLTRLALYLVFFGGLGAVLFRAVIPATAPPSTRWPRAVLLAGVLILPMSVGMQGLDALAAPWSALRTLAPWRTSLATSYGVTAGLMLASLITASLAAWTRGRLVRPAALAALLLLAAALAASGHASSAMPVWLARPAVAIHVVAVTLWIGSLLPLLLALREQRGVAPLMRFSRAIPWVVLMLIASGATLTVLQLDGVPSLWRTNYGRILSAKLVFVLALLGVAAFNRYRLTEKVQGGDALARRGMRRLIGVELLLALVVLGLVTTWRFTPPPRALAVAAARPTSIHLHSAQAMVDLTLTPQPEQRQRADLMVTIGATGAQQAKEVTLAFSHPALGTEPLRRAAVLQEDGSWRVDAFALPAAGSWHVQVDVLISDFEQARLDGELERAK